MKKVDSVIEAKIIDLYNSGLSMKEVGKQVNVSPKTVLSYLDKNNIEKRTKGGIYRIPEEDIISLYTKGMSSSEIAKKYHVTAHTITAILEKNSIQRDNRYRNTGLNLNYFSKIDSYDKAYFLGFITADGNITGNFLKIGLNIKDKYILDTFNEKTNNSNKLYFRKDKPEVSAGAKSAQWKNDLAKYGIVPNKTKITYIPFDMLEEKYLSHYIRGIFDGDGWISYTGDSRYNLGFCGGNEKIVTDFKQALLQRLDIYPVKTILSKKGVYEVQWSSKSDIIKICQYMYQDKQDCFLTRKYNTYLNIQGNTEVID